MLDKLTGFHLELTNICLLKCPRCPRTKFIEQFGINRWSNQNLDLVALQRFLDVDIRGKKIALCGDYGDPIYYKELFPLIDYLKKHGAVISLTTNGSYQKMSWWEQLVNKLDQKDTITFSVDGAPENFTQYRINADWDSIEIAMRVVGSSGVNSKWKYIPFNFNEHSIDKSRELSFSLGIKNFLVQPSDRWDGDQDPYRPKQYYGPRESAIIQWHNTKKLIVDAKCKNTNSEHYISAQGFYMPCCFIGDHRFYYKSEFYKNRSQFDISKNTFTEVLNNLTEFYNNVEISNHQYCTFNCPKI